MQRMKKVLVTGANGQLGKELRFLSKERDDFDFIFTDSTELDITNSEQIEFFFEKNNVDFIINCAAYTQVNKAEEDKDRAFLLNTVSVDFLIDAAIKYKATLIQISTDYVFDGEKNTPYNEEDINFPLNTYGETKLESEKLILYATDLNAFIIRTSWLYSSFGSNFVKTMLKLGEEKEEINVVFDQIGTPTYARDLGRALLKIMEKTETKQKNKSQEIYHFSNEGVASWYDFAKEIFRNKNINCKVNPVNTSFFNYAAKRPAFSVLDKAKIKKEFGMEIPHWAESLKEMLKEQEEIE